MSDFGVIDGFPRTATYGAVTGSSTGTVVTGSASANTYGSWTELVASTSFDTDLLIATFADPSKVGAQLYDLAVGAAGSEQPIAEGLINRVDTLSKGSTATYALPLYIPAGSRISCRVNNEQGSTSSKVLCMAKSGGFSSKSFQKLEKINAGAATFSGYSANTKGAWQSFGSTDKAYRGLHIAYALLDFDTSGSTTMLMDVGFGSAGSEVVAIANLLTAGQTGSAITRYSWQNFAIEGEIPSGTPISGRFQSSGASSANRYWYVVIYGYL